MLNSRASAPASFCAPADHGIYLTTRRFASLDGWRAVAIIAVIFHHTLGQSFSAPIAAQGRHGVTLFFVISGFLIVTLILRSKDINGRFSLPKFWGRRVLRIFPIYYGALLLYTVLVHLTEHSTYGEAFTRNLPFFASFTTNWFVTESSHTIFFFSWSIAAEEQFYLMWPIIEAVLARPSHIFMLLGVLIIVSQYLLGHYTPGAGGLLMRVLYYIPLGIMLGTALAHILHEKRSFRGAYILFGQRGSGFAVLGFTVGVMLIAPYIGFAGEVLVAVAMLGLVASCVIREDNDLARFLRWPPLVWVGTVSYGMYMLHMLAVNIVRKIEHVAHIHTPYIDFAGGLLMALILASGSFMLYERPFLILKDKLFREAKPAMPPASTVTENLGGPLSIPSERLTA
jgi:peptidoglycan/LPS O-acetylase OafA/YrhL